MRNSTMVEVINLLLNIPLDTIKIHALHDLKKI